MTTPVASTTTGKIFQISRSDFMAGVTPTNELSTDHPFSVFWLDFLTKITTPRACQRLIDGFTSVYLRDENWADGLSLSVLGSLGEQTINIIRNNPPDILILDQPAQAGYCLHLRQPERRPVTKFWFGEWTLAMAFDPKRRLALALEAVLRATLVHGMSHWILPCAGPHSQEFSDAFNQQNLSSLSPQATQEGEKKSTPKSMRADWTGSGGEAGSYVELYAGGGTIGFNVSRDDVFIRTDADTFWSPSTPFLFSLRQRGYELFVPRPLDMPMPRPPLTIQIPSATPSIPFSPSRPHIFASDYCDVAEGMFALSNIMVDIPKHSGDRLLASSVVKERNEREGMAAGLGLSFTNF